MSEAEPCGHEESAAAAELGADLASYHAAVERAERVRGCGTIELASAHDDINTHRTELNLQKVRQDNEDGIVALGEELVDLLSPLG